MTSPAWVQVGMFWATVGLVLISVMAAGVTYYILRAQVDPHVIVYSKHDELRPGLLLIVIHNAGGGPAYNVRFQVDRPIPREKSQGAVFIESGPLIDGVPLLAPGERRVINWGTYLGLIDVCGKHAVRVICTFESKHDMPWDPTDHVTVSLIEIASFAGTDAARSIQVRQVDALEEISKTLRQIERTLHNPT